MALRRRNLLWEHPAPLEYLDFDILPGLQAGDSYGSQIHCYT
jgi:hypothetical protein